MHFTISAWFVALYCGHPSTWGDDSAGFAFDPIELGSLPVQDKQRISVPILGVKRELGSDTLRTTGPSERCDNLTTKVVSPEDVLSRPSTAIWKHMGSRFRSSLCDVASSS